VKHYFENVSGLGNVAVSRHAQAKMIAEHITEEQFTTALVDGRDVSSLGGVREREAGGLRLVILERPIPFKGAMLVKTVYRVKEQAKTRR
jgi:hypothetical protein